MSRQQQQPISLRNKVSEAAAKKIIDSVFLNTVTPLTAEEYSEVWEEVIEASGEDSFSKASARLFSFHPDLALELHKINPWVPTSNELSTIAPFLYTLIRSTLLTAPSGVDMINKDSHELSSEFIDHISKVLASVKEAVNKLEKTYEI